MEKYLTKYKIKKPNFFIIGAPKCGTTSLSEYLRTHPDIYFSNPKEPHYFNKDMLNEHKNHFTEKKYLKKCFTDSTRYKAVGEGTAMYLFSKEAVPNILKFNPEAKFIIMIRNPIEMFFSFFSTLFIQLVENQKDPQRAWELQENRAKGKSIPLGRKHSELLQYGQICKLGEQIERLFENVPNKKNIIIIEFEEFKKNTKKCYEDVLVFLGLKTDNKNNFSIYNKGAQFKNIAIAKILHLMGQGLLGKTSQKMKKMLKIKHWCFSVKIARWNSKNIEFKQNKKFEEKLISYFRDDIKKLSEIIGKDLSHWTE
jgi:hypothetical protein